MYGFWKLVSLRFVISDTGESGDMYGADPVGYLVMTAEGRMMAVITANGRDPAQGEAALFNTMMAYSGAFRIEGEDQFITDVEVSWHPGWVGTEQARTFSVQGDTLFITTAETTHPQFPGGTGRGVLEWHRAAA
ncbi:MAG: lipocalin-like domain-containing protein [Cypionkella sp.]